jgi:hypothetical protein
MGTLQASFSASGGKAQHLPFADSLTPFLKNGIKI